MRSRVTAEELAKALTRNPSLRAKRPVARPQTPSRAKMEPLSPVSPAQPQVRAVRRDYKAELLMQIRVSGIPAPETEHIFHSTRKWRFDFCWPGKMVACEYQGGIYTQGKQGHQTTAGISRDCLKFSSAAALGWRLLPINAQMVLDGTALALIEQALNLALHQR